MTVKSAKPPVHCALIIGCVIIGLVAVSYHQGAEDRDFTRRQNSVIRNLHLDSGSELECCGDCSV